MDCMTVLTSWDTVKYLPQVNRVIKFLVALSNDIFMSKHLIGTHNSTIASRSYIPPRIGNDTHNIEPSGNS